MTVKPEMQNILSATSHLLGPLAAQHNHGFVLMIFPIEENADVTYITSLSQLSLVQLLRNSADSVETYINKQGAEPKKETIQ